jgi:hypothetical protein
METKGKSPTSQGLILENLEMDGTSIQKKWIIVGKSQIHSRWSEGYIVQHIIFTQLR